MAKSRSVDSDHRKNDGSRDAPSSASWTQNVRSECSSSQLNRSVNQSLNESPSTDKTQSSPQLLDTRLEIEPKTNTNREKSSKSSSSSQCHASNQLDERRRAVIAQKNDIVNRYREPAVLGKMTENLGRKVKLARYHLVTEVVNRGREVGYPKQQQRAAPSRWRRYGPTKYIYEAGGWIGSAKARKKDYKFIKPGTKPPPSPKDEPLLALNVDPNHRKCEVSLHIPGTCDTPVDAAHQLALQISNHVEAQWSRSIGATNSSRLRSEHEFQLDGGHDDDGDSSSEESSGSDPYEIMPTEQPSADDLFKPLSAKQNNGSKKYAALLQTPTRSVRNLLRKVFRSPNRPPQAQPPAGNSDQRQNEQSEAEQKKNESVEKKAE